VPGEDYVNAYGFDVTEQKRLERQFAQSQKMEAVGHLAGGVAHDFRNQLTIIKGFAEILLQRGKLPEEARSRMEQILEAADRSSHLTSQLLAFSRQDVLRPEFMNVDDMLRSLQKSFLKVLGEDIRFSVHTEGEGLCVKVDPVQLNQALLNLAINARDAMPHGGELIIRAEREELGYDFVRPYEDRRPGPYVMLSVSDTGCGMDAETCRRAFEPFFTSKEVGKGTGLGLAMVYGFVTQSGGIVTCESEPGEGTTFRMYFPAADARECCPKQDEQREPLRRGGGTVLVVEDEESVRRMMVETLREAGFDVLHAAHPHAAMIMAWENREFLDVLVTDMIMPAMTGLELASRTHVQCPRAKVLYVSGYVGEELVRRGVEVPREQLLQKPFTPNDLIDRVAGMVEQAED
jgi:nitrogen-specific signal transduction histidine kinase/ActR/RegA family two-component response regulator